MKFRAIALIAFLISPRIFAAADPESFWTHGQGKTPGGVPFQTDAAFVDEDHAEEALSEIAAVAQEHPNAKVVLSTDDPNGPVTQQLDPFFKKSFPDAPRFWLKDGASGRTLPERIGAFATETKEAVKKYVHENKGGFYFSAFVSVVSTIMYIHVSNHPSFTSTGLPAIMSAILYFAFANPSDAILPHTPAGEILKEKIDRKETQLGEKIGLAGREELFRVARDIFHAEIGYFAWADIAGSFTTRHWFWQPIMLKASFYISQLNTTVLSPWFFAARRLYGAGILTRAEVNVMLRARMLAMAFLYPYVSVYTEGILARGQWLSLKDVTEPYFLLTVAVGAVGWRLLFRGNTDLPKIMNSTWYKDAVARGERLKQSLQVKKMQIQLRLSTCSEWLKFRKGNDRL